MAAYTDEQLNFIYELLFSDDVELYRSAEAAGDAYPIKQLLDESTDDESLAAIVRDPAVESRLKVLASNILLKRGVTPAEKHLFGVIVEVSLEEGLDTLAVYEDGRARYINYSGKLIVWETMTIESDMLKDDLFAAAQAVVDQIGPWDRERLVPPVKGNVRISFLVSDGLYFGEAPFQTLAADPMGGAVIDRAGRFMTFLVQQAMAQEE